MSAYRERVWIGGARECFQYIILRRSFDRSPRPCFGLHRHDHRGAGGQGGVASRPPGRRGRRRREYVSCVCMCVLVLCVCGWPGQARLMPLFTWLHRLTDRLVSAHPTRPNHHSDVQDPGDGEQHRGDARHARLRAEEARQGVCCVDTTTRSWTGSIRWAGASQLLASPLEGTQSIEPRPTDRPTAPPWPHSKQPQTTHQSTPGPDEAAPRGRGAARGRAPLRGGGGARGQALAHLRGNRVHEGRPGGCVGGCVGGCIHAIMWAVVVGGDLTAVIDLISTYVADSPTSPSIHQPPPPPTHTHIRCSAPRRRRTTCTRRWTWCRTG